MLAEQRRAPRGSPGRGVHDERPAGVLERSGPWVIDRVPGVATPDVRIPQQLPDREQCSAEDAEVLRLAQRLELRCALQELRVGRLELLDELAGHVGGRLEQLFPGDQILAPDQREEARQPGAEPEQVDVAVHRRPDAARRKPAARPASHRVARVGRAGQVDHAPVAEPGLALVHREVDVVARASRLDAVADKQDGERGRRSGRVVRHMTGELQRFPAAVPGQQQRPAQRLEGDLGTQVVAIGPVLTERRERQHHEVLAVAGEFVPAPTPGGGVSCVVVLDHDVALRGEAADRRRPLGGRRIDRRGALVGVEVEEQAGRLGILDVARERSEAASGVAAGRLELEHVGPVVGEELRRVRACDVTCQVQHAKTLERSCHRRHLRSPRISRLAVRRRPEGRVRAQRMIRRAPDGSRRRVAEGPAPAGLARHAADPA